METNPQNPVNRIVIIGSDQFVITPNQSEPRKISAVEAQAFLNRSGLGGIAIEFTAIETFLEDNPSGEVGLDE